jgi:hypothetical protein
VSRPRLHSFADDLEAVRDRPERLLALGPERLWVGHGGSLDPRNARRAFGRRR